MNILKYLAGILIIFIVVLIGVEMLYFAVNPAEDLQNFYTVLLDEWLPPGHIFTIIKLVIGGVFLIALSAVFLYTSFFQSKKQAQTISYNTSSGEITIATKAVENYIKKISTRIDGIQDIQTAVEKSGSTLIFYIKANVSPGRPKSLPELINLLKTSIENSVRDDLGIQDSFQIKPFIGELDISKSSPPKPSEPSGAPVPTTPPEEPMV